MKKKKNWKMFKMFKMKQIFKENQIKKPEYGRYVMLCKKNKIKKFTKKM